jgi:hypothetical protein
MVSVLVLVQSVGGIGLMLWLILQRGDRA